MPFSKKKGDYQFSLQREREQHKVRELVCISVGLLTDNFGS